jgi:hypothetical protein
LERRDLDPGKRAGQLLRRQHLAEVNVLSLFGGNGTYTFGLAHADDDYCWLYAKESFAPAELVIQQVP